METVNTGLLPSNHLLLPDNSFPKLLPTHKSPIFPSKFNFETSPSRRYHGFKPSSVLSTQINSSAHLVPIPENAKEYTNQVPRRKNKVDDYLSLLNLFDKTRNFPCDCKQIHAYFTKLGKMGSDNLVRNEIAMYYLKRKGSLDDARKLFDEMPERTLRLYAALIGSYSKSEKWEELLEVLGLMVDDGMLPNKYLVPTILKACSAVKLLRSGKMVHGYVVRNVLAVDTFVGNALIDLYANCGDLRYSRSVFDVMHERDVVSWTTLVSAYMGAGLLEEAEHIFDSMQLNGVKPDVVSWNALVCGFAQNGEIHLAILSLEEMQEKGLKPRVTSWNGIISGCVHNGYFEDALDVFSEMLRFPQNPNVVTIASILPACAGLKALKLGKTIHGYAIKNDIYRNIHVDGSLVAMYSKCGRNDYAEKVFIEIETKNTAVWNEMIAAYVNAGKMDAALGLLIFMQNDGLKPDEITYNTLLAGYARNGKKNEAYALLSDMTQMDMKLNNVSFNVLISGFQQYGLTLEALKLFRIMQLPSNNGFIDENLFVSAQPNTVTITGALAACADLNLLCQGKEIHGYVLKNNFEPNIFVSSALVDMYAKCHDIASAIKIFRKIEDKNTVAWNSVIAGHIYNSQPEEALQLFHEMLSEGAEPSSITMMILLLACGEMEALSVGRQLHSYVVKHNPDELNNKLLTALIDMYAKFNCILDAKLVFDFIVDKDICMWNSMISAYSVNGMAENAIALFEQMEMLGIVPDNKTFVALLTACSCDGLVDEGWNYFNSMVKNYGIFANLEHYKCMVHNMGTAGLLDEALDLIEQMPHVPDASIWDTLLQACRVHSNTVIGQQAAKALFELERKNVTNS